MHLADHPCLVGQQHQLHLQFLGCQAFPADQRFLDIRHYPLVPVVQKHPVFHWHQLIQYILAYQSDQLDRLSQCHLGVPVDQMAHDHQEVPTAQEILVDQVILENLVRLEVLGDLETLEFQLIQKVQPVQLDLESQ